MALPIDERAVATMTTSGMVVPRIGDCCTWKKVEAKVQPAQPEIPPSSGMMVPVR